MLNQQEIEHIIHKFFKYFKKTFNKIEQHFAEDDIHDFRVEYKKLRAFLRLLMLEIADTENLEMPRNLKEIYRLNGKIREMQLQLNRVDETVNAKENFPVYRTYLKKEMKNLKKDLKPWLKHEPVAGMEEKIFAHLPPTLEAGTIQKFISIRFANIQALFEGRTIADESLHRIRKNIKDILYVYKIFEGYGVVKLNELFGPKSMYDEAAILAEELGKFNDLCIALTLLRPEWISHVKHEEKILLYKTRMQWMKEKENLKHNLVEIVLPRMLFQQKAKAI